MARRKVVVHLSVQQLSVALEQLGVELEEDSVHTGDNSQEVFAVYAADHGQDPRT